MRNNLAALSFIVLPSVIALSVKAVPRDGVLSGQENLPQDPIPYAALGEEPLTEVNTSICEKFPEGSRKKTICFNYDNNNKSIKPVKTLPSADSKLKPDTLYLVNNTSELTAPYKLPSGTSILPSPTTEELELTFTGHGTDGDCGPCAIKLGEGSRLAGLSVNMKVSHWKPTTQHGKEHAIFYGATSESEISESKIWGRSDFVDLIHQKQTVSEDKMLSYHRLAMYAEGSQNLIRVENTSTTAAKIPDDFTWNVDIVDVIGTLSGNIPSSAQQQTGFQINNLIANILKSSVFYDSLDSSKTFSRVGVLGIDTPHLYLFDVSYNVLKKGYDRDYDLEEAYENKLQKSMTVYSDHNTYLDIDDEDHFLNSVTPASALTYYLGENYRYSSVDVDNSAENIDRLTSNGGFYLGNAMKLESMCPVNASDYNPNAPYPAVNGDLIVRGPSNATLESYSELCIHGSKANACNISLKTRLIDGSVGFSIGFVAGGALFGIPLAIALACVCVKHSPKKDYQKIGDNK